MARDPEAIGQTVQFPAVLEKIRDGFIALDRNYRCIYINPAAAAFLNTSPDALTGHLIWEAFPPARYPQLHEEISQAAEQEVFTKFDEYCERCGRWYEWHCYPTDDILAIVIEDISERKRAEEAVVRSEQHYRLLFETMPEGVVYQDSAGKIVSMNPAAEEILGRTPAEFLGRTSVDEEHHTLREDGSPFPGLEHPPMMALRTGREVRNVIMGVFNPRRQAYRWINVSAVPLVRPGEDKPYQVYTHFSDITELRQAVRALQQSERRFRKLFEADLMGIFITKPDGTFLDCNEAMVKMLGYSSREEVLARRSSDFYVDPEFRAEAVRILQTKGVYLGQEGRVWRKDGSIAYLLGAAVLLKDEETGEPYVQGVAIDITERKRIEEALRRSEERYRKLFEANLAGVYLTKLDGTILNFNEAMQKMLGYDSRAEVFQKRSADFYVDPAFRQELLRQLRQDGIVRGREALLRRKDGSALYALGAAALLTDEQTGEQYIQGVAVDITERKRAEERLAKSLKDLEFLSVSATRYLETMSSRELFQYTAGQLQAIAGQALIAVSEYGPDTHEVTVRALAGPEDKRQRIVELLGRDPVGLLFALTEDTRTQMVRGRLEWVKGSLYDLTFHQIPLPLARQIERECRIEEIYAMPVYLGEDLIGTVAVATDRVEGLRNRELLEAIVNQAALALKRTRTEEALRESEQALRDLTATLESRVARRTAQLEHRARQLQRLTLQLSEAEDQERRRLAEILHDDLQQVLAGAKFHVGLMRKRSQSDPALQATGAQVEHMLREAIEKSRSLSHELSPVVMRHEDFAETLRWLADEIQTKHGLHVDVRAHGPICPRSDAVKTFLYRAAREMLFNVVKHAHVQEARLLARQLGSCLCLSVRDRGRGFDPEQLREAVGFGLLSIHERTELLGGRMRIKSAPGQGSTLFVAVPDGLELRGEERQAAVGAEEKEGGPQKPPVRVLLADDHEIVRQGLVSLLEEEHTVEVIGEAANGHEAVELAARLRPDVVIMDVAMPVMGGEEATRRIKQDRPETRIISLSMFEEPEVRERMRQAGAESHVLKTAPAEELLAAVRGEGADS